MRNTARHMLFGRNVPQFLQADPENLGVAILLQVEAFHQLLRQMPADAFGKEGIFGMEFQPRLPRILARAITRDAHVTGGDALYRAIVVPQDFGGSEPGENLHPQRFGLARQPAAQIAKADGVTALVVHERRHQGVRKIIFLRFAEDPVFVVRHRHRHRTVEIAPVRQKLIERARVDDRPRQDVRTNLRTFFEDADRQFEALVGRHLLRPDRRRQAGRPAPDDDQVIGH